MIETKHLVSSYHYRVAIRGHRGAEKHLALLQKVQSVISSTGEFVNANLGEVGDEAFLTLDTLDKGFSDVRLSKLLSKAQVSFLSVDYIVKSQEEKAEEVPSPELIEIHDDSIKCCYITVKPLLSGNRSDSTEYRVSALSRALYSISKDAHIIHLESNDEAHNYEISNIREGIGLDHIVQAFLRVGYRVVSAINPMYGGRKSLPQGKY